MRTTHRNVFLLVVATVVPFIGGGAGPVVAQAQQSRRAANGLIAYDAAGDIWAVNADGSDRHQLTTGPELELAPAWSRDGTMLAFWSQAARNSSPSSLIVVEANGSDGRVVATDAEGRIPARMDWSPDGTRIVYSLGPAAGSTEPEHAYIATIEGGGSRQVGNPQLTTRMPEWSPDGSLIAFGGGRAGSDPGSLIEQAVYLMAPDGSGVRRLSDVYADWEYQFWRVEWSPDGTTIATNAGGAIWLFPLDGTNNRSITGAVTGVDSIAPRWSADGDRVAYVSLRANADLRVVPAGGGDLRSLGTSESGYSWSPDGTRIVASRTVGSGPGWVIVDPGTGAVVTSFEARDPAYPDNIYPSWQAVL